MTSEKEEKRRTSWGSSWVSTSGGPQNQGPGGEAGSKAPQSPWGSMPEELGLRLGDRWWLLVGFLHGDGGALRLLFSGLDEVTRCLLIRYLLTETPLTKTDIARALGWGRHTELVDKILKMCQDNNDVNSTVMPKITAGGLEEAIRECVSNNCGRAKTIIRTATYTDMPPFMLVIGSYVVNALKNFGLSICGIRRVMAVNKHALRRLMMLSEFFEFSRIGEFRPRTVFDAYWQFTSLTTLRLPFIIKSRFDPPNDVCGVFRDEGLCHEFIAGYLIAEAKKSTKEPYRRFKQINTTHPASVTLLLGIANHLAMRYGIMTKVYIDERWREVYFMFGDLPRDVERFVEDVWGDTTTLTKLTDEEFLTFLSGLLAGDGSIVWGDVVDVVIAGNLEREKPLYVVVHDELRRRFGIEPSLREEYSNNGVRLVTRKGDAMRLLRTLPPLIEPLKELRKQVLLRRDMLGVRLAGKLFGLLGDGRNGEKGIRKMQSHQAVRFLITLLRLGLVKLKPEGRHHILEPPQTHAGGLN